MGRTRTISRIEILDNVHCPPIATAVDNRLSIFHRYGVGRDGAAIVCGVCGGIGRLGEASNGLTGQTTLTSVRIGQLVVDGHRCGRRVRLEGVSGIGIDELAIDRRGILGKESGSEGRSEVAEGEDAREGHESVDNIIEEYDVRK